MSPRHARGLASLPSGAGTGLVELPLSTPFPQLCQGQIAHRTDRWPQRLPQWGLPQLPLSKHRQCPRTSSPSSQSSPCPSAGATSSLPGARQGMSLQGWSSSALGPPCFLSCT